MTTRTKMVIAAAVMAMFIPGAALAQGRSSQGHCEGAYDETQGTNFGLCASPDMEGESKSPSGEIPETPSE